MALYEKRGFTQNPQCEWVFTCQIHVFDRKCHIERIPMPSLLAHQPGPVSHTGVTFLENVAQIWTKKQEI